MKKHRSKGFFSHNKPLLTGLLLIVGLTALIIFAAIWLGSGALTPQTILEKKAWTDQELVQASLTTFDHIQEDPKGKEWQSARSHLDSTVKSLPPERRKEVVRGMVDAHLSSNIEKLRLAMSKLSPEKQQQAVDTLVTQLAKVHITSEQKKDMNKLPGADKEEAQQVAAAAVTKSLEKFSPDERRVYAPVVKEAVRILEEWFN